MSRQVDDTVTDNFDTDIVPGHSRNSMPINHACLVLSWGINIADTNIGIVCALPIGAGWRLLG